MLKFILLMLIIFPTSVCLANSPIIFDGTYEFAEVVPIHTDWTYMVHGGSDSGKKKLNEYRENGFTCRHTHSLRYQCRKRVKGEIPQDLKIRLTQQYQDFYFDFEPYIEIKNISKNKWRFDQTVIINERVFLSYVFDRSKFPYWLYFPSKSNDLSINAVGRRELRVNVRKSSKEATANAYIKMVKLTP